MTDTTQTDPTIQAESGGEAIQNARTETAIAALSGWIEREATERQRVAAEAFRDRVEEALREVYYIDSARAAVLNLIVDPRNAAEKWIERGEVKGTEPGYRLVDLLDRIQSNLANGPALLAVFVAETAEELAYEAQKIRGIEAAREGAR